MPLTQVKVYYWDFFGPDARTTAGHFKTHLEEFLRAREVEGCETGLESVMPGHSAALCKTPPAHESTIETYLRPRRALWGELDLPETFDV